MALRTSHGECVACGGPVGEAPFPSAIGAPATGGDLHRCRHCAGLQVMPRPDRMELARLYDRDYYEDFRRGLGIAGGNDEVSPVLAARLAWITKLLSGRGRLLDLGCGPGHFVARAREDGWEAVGVEPSEWAAEAARRRHRIVVHNSALEDAPVEPGSLDVIHANHVVEHLPDPLGTLQTAFNLLRPGGLLVLEVPQELRAPLSDRFLGWLYRWPAPASQAISHHLQFFTPRGLAATVRRAGFDVVNCATVRHGKSLDSSLPLGVGRAGRALLFWAEERSGTAPSIVLVGRRAAADRMPSRAGGGARA